MEICTRVVISVPNYYLNNVLGKSLVNILNRHYIIINAFFDEFFKLLFFI